MFSYHLPFLSFFFLSITCFYYQLSFDSRPLFLPHFLRTFLDPLSHMYILLCLRVFRV